MHTPILMVIQNCESMCEYMITFLGEEEDIEERRKQIRLLRDCADICTLTVKYISRHSIFAKHLADLCSFICDSCGKECMNFKDLESQNCAKMCMDCARECRSYSMVE